MLDHEFRLETPGRRAETLSAAVVLPVLLLIRVILILGRVALLPLLLLLVVVFVLVPMPTCVTVTLSTVSTAIRPTGRPLLCAHRARAH